MFLNDVGQPLILNSTKTYGPFEQHNGPMLLTAAAFKHHVVPENWCGRIIGSQEDVARMITQSKTLYRYQILTAYKPMDIEYDKTKITLTLIPAGQSDADRVSTLYFMQSSCIRALICDSLSGYLDFIPKAGENFHRALGVGFDVMYVDDLCYLSEEPESLAQQEYLYSLVRLIRPKYLFSLRQHKLPNCLLDLCARRD